MFFTGKYHQTVLDRKQSSIKGNATKRKAFLIKRTVLNMSQTLTQIGCPIGKKIKPGKNCN